MNNVECTTFKTIISILNSLAYALGAHVSICRIFKMKIAVLERIRKESAKRGRLVKLGRKEV